MNVYVCPLLAHIANIIDRRLQIETVRALLRHLNVRTQNPIEDNIFYVPLRTLKPENLFKQCRWCSIVVVIDAHVCAVCCCHRSNVNVPTIQWKTTRQSAAIYEYIYMLHIYWDTQYCVLVLLYSACLCFRQDVYIYRPSSRYLLENPTHVRHRDDPWDNTRQIQVIEFSHPIG